MSRTWDLVILGGGTAGLVAAQTAAALGARVALVEADRPGGDCLWTGCVPSKSLIAAARVAAEARTGHRFGVNVGRVEIDFAAVMAHVRSAIAAIEPHDSADTLRGYGVTVHSGRGRLTHDLAVEVNGTRLQARSVLLATGSEPMLPPVDGLADSRALTTDTIWDLAGLPGRLTVLGGGTTGCELAQAFARLGSRVTIVEGEVRLLSGEDPDASLVVTHALEADGVRVLTGTHATSASRDRLTLDDGQVIEHDALLVATGRRPRTSDLGLERAGVDIDDHGFVRVDEHLRTTNPRVFAAGDLTGHPQLTHVAGVHGSVAATNALLGLRRRAETEVIPRVTFSDPEVAAVGVSTADAEQDEDLSVLTERYAGLDRAITESRPEGFTRLVVDKRGRVMGATVVGPRAGESLAELVLAIGQGLRARDLVGSMHAYPTYADAAWNAAITRTMSRLSQPIPRSLVRSWLRLRRVLPRR